MIVHARETDEVLVFAGDHFEHVRKPVVQESELALVVNGQQVVSMLCTNDALEELVVGFLRTEGLICGLGDIAHLDVDAARLVATVELRCDVDADARPRVISSGFGGKTLSRGGRGSVLPTCARYSPATILALGRATNACAAMHAHTGGIHCSALFQGGRLVASFEDIGRHNTFDKIAGHCLMAGVSAKDAVLITTGRISSEMLRKAVGLGIAVLGSFSSPTSLAIEHAKASRVTLVGYLRSDSFVLHTDFGRIDRESSPIGSLCLERYPASA